MSGVKHFKDEDNANGSLSPSKMAKIDTEGDKEKLTRVMGYFGAGKEPPVIRPKPKPRPRPKPVKTTPTHTDHPDGTDQVSPGVKDPGPILLSADSLAQFGEVLDLDAVVRYQMLDSTPQKDRAALSQSKGLQNRRLPSHVASLVGDDRPPPRQPAKENKRPRPQPQFVEETDAGESEQLTEEEKRQKVMAKAGISQSNPLAALGNILRKGPGRGSGRESKSPRRENPVVKQRSFKGSKESLRDGAKDSPEPSRKSSEPKSPKLFRFGIRRSSSRNKKGEGDDMASETSSVSSLNVHPVKEELMETEPSSLSISKSALENGVTADSTAGETSTLSQPPASPTAADASKSGNRTSMYFKAPEVEPLSGLFDSGELDALLQKSSDSKEPSPEQATTEEAKQEAKQEAKPEAKQETNEEAKKEEGEEQLGSGSGLRRSALRSSFRMYEKQYKAETMEREKRRKEKSPLSSSQSKTDVTSAEKSSIFDDGALDSEPQEMPSSSGTELSTSTPKEEAKVDKVKLVADDDILKGASPVVATQEKKTSTEEKQKPDTERRRRRLFDDELFQSEFQSRTRARAQKTSTTAPRWDAYAQARKSPPPETASVGDAESEKPSEEKPSEEKPKVHGVFGESLKDYETTSEKKNVKEPSISKEDKEEEEVDGAAGGLQSDSKIDRKKEQKPSLFGFDESETTHDAGKAEKKREEEEKNVSPPPSPPCEPKSDPLGALQTTELEKESQKREADKVTAKKRKESEEQEEKEVSEPKLPTDGTPQDSAAEDTPKETVVEQEKPKKEEDKLKEDKPVIPEAKDSTDKETAAKSDEKAVSRARQRREEKEEQKGSRYTRLYDSRSRIEAGKVSNVKSKFDSGAASSSPRLQRSRAATDTSRLSAERKPRSATSETGKGSPSWMTELQKRKEQRKEKDKDTTGKVTASSEDKDEDMPEWRKRIMERKRKAAEAGNKTSSVVGKTGQSTASPRLGRRTETTSGRASPRGEKSPRHERKSPAGTTGKTSSAKATDSPKSSRIRSREGAGKSEPVTEKKSALEGEVQTEETDTPTAEDVKKTASPERKKPDITVDTRQRTRSADKPAITSPKPKIDIVSMKAVRKSDSTEPKEESKKRTVSIEVRSSKSPTPSDSVGEKAKDEEQSSKKPEPLGSEGEKDAGEKNSITSVGGESEEQQEVKSQKTQGETEEDEVFSNDKLPAKEDVHSPSPQLSSNLLNQVLTESRGSHSGSRSGSRRSSASSDQEATPYRSRSISHSRSPTPTSQPTGPLKLVSDPSIPEWKKKVLERKKAGVPAKKPDLTSSKRKEPEMPAWKKELLSKRKDGEESKLASRVRSGTAPAKSFSSTRTGRKKEQPVPEFMKEFQSKKKSAKD